MRKICYVSSRLCKKCKKNHSCTSKMRKPPNLANSLMAPYFFIYANRNKAEPRKVTKQVVWIILHNRICHGTIRHIRSGFSLYARTLCALTLIAYALKHAFVCVWDFLLLKSELQIKYDRDKKLYNFPSPA